jgi:hypothetical protein
MKKSILALVMTAVLISCTKAPCPEATPKAIGYEVSDDGVKIPLYSGDLSNVAIWERYIVAHNERDLETIKSLNAAEGFKAYAPTGQIIDGTDAHIAFLTTWFAALNYKILNHSIKLSMIEVLLFCKINEIRPMKFGRFKKKNIDSAKIGSNSYSILFVCFVIFQ